MNDMALTPRELAPIVLFVYKRAWHTEQTLRALMANDYADQSILYVYSDSPKHLAGADEVAAVEKVRRLVRSEQWCKEVHLVEATRNKGLVTSFVDGITEVINQHGRIIVLEDDQVTSKGFLKYMNEALELYKDDDKVMHISGYMYPAKFKSKETTFFLNVQSCPGWGTWMRAWQKYNHDAADHYQYFSQNPQRRKKFDIEGHAYYFKQLERNAGSPELYSWAVRWYASCLRAEGLSLFPARSLVRNIGCDDTGEHCKNTGMYDVETVDYLDIKKIPLVENMKIRKSIDRHYKHHLENGLAGSIRKIPEKMKKGLKCLGVRGLKPVRTAIRYVYPELQQLDTALAKRVGLLSSAHECAISSKCRLYPPYHLHQSSVGEYSYVMPGSWISMCHIGKFCSIGPRFMAGGGIHPTDGISTAPMFYSLRRQNGMSLSKTNKVKERKLITVGNDVFIGMSVTVLDGVTIGDGAVIGAGCVVSKDVPPYAVAVGNPMKIIHYRFDDEVREKLQSIAWWDWPEDRLQDVEHHFLDLQEFIHKHYDSPDRPVQEEHSINQNDIYCEWQDRK